MSKAKKKTVYVIKANGFYWGLHRTGWQHKGTYRFGGLRNALRFPTRKEAEAARVVSSDGHPHGTIVPIRTHP